MRCAILCRANFFNLWKVTEVRSKLQVIDPAMSQLRASAPEGFLAVPASALQLKQVHPGQHGLQQAAAGTYTLQVIWLPTLPLSEQ